MGFTVKGWTFSSVYYTPSHIIILNLTPLLNHLIKLIIINQLLTMRNEISKQAGLAQNSQALILKHYIVK